jgi:hypothetical protein
MDASKYNSAIVAIGLVAAFSVVAGIKGYYRGNGAKSVAMSNDNSKADDDETFQSHVCDHDGAGLVELSEGTLWHVTVKFNGNGPPWYVCSCNNFVSLLSFVSTPCCSMNNLS